MFKRFYVSSVNGTRNVGHATFPSVVCYNDSLHCDLNSYPTYLLCENG